MTIHIIARGQGDYYCRLRWGCCSRWSSRSSASMLMLANLIKWQIKWAIQVAMMRPCVLKDSMQLASTRSQCSKHGQHSVATGDDARQRGGNIPIWVAHFPWPGSHCPSDPRLDRKISPCEPLTPGAARASWTSNLTIMAEHVVLQH